MSTVATFSPTRNLRRCRAYASPVPREEVAQRIADSIRYHTRRGLTRLPQEYTASPQTLALVMAILSAR